MNIAVVDLGYGDCGKGTVVDWICSTQEVAAVVRFNGGPQAGHNVVQPDGRHHKFSQFGSGTFHGVPTLLSHHMLVDPLRLNSEAAHLEEVGVAKPFDLLAIDEKCLVVTPYHGIAQRTREMLRGNAKHGTCGTGFGEAVMTAHLPSKAIPMEYLYSYRSLRDRLIQIRNMYQEEFPKLPLPDPEQLVETYLAVADKLNVVNGAGYLSQLHAFGNLVFEGAQGVLLDQVYGFQPYTTWSNTTFVNAEDLIAELGDVYRLGVVRSYTTRHGPGPHVTEQAGTGFSGEHNTYNEHQGHFRVGCFDAVAHRYAVKVCERVDGLAVTHLDRSYDVYCEEYDTIEPVDRTFYGNAMTEILMEAKPILQKWKTGDRGREIADLLGLPLALESFGPSTDHKKVHGWLKK